jgi:dTMP kinase
VWGRGCGSIRLNITFIDSLMKTYPGKFITLEGIEGVGKSTQLQYIKNWLTEKNIPVLATREPGGTPVAESIRAIFLEKLPETITTDTELLLLFAGRAQHLATVILPALQRGEWVICDRFTDASYAYQSGGRQVPLERVTCLKNWVHEGFAPDLTLLFDAPVDIALSRVQKRGGSDRIEAEDKAFFERVRTCYLALAKQASRYQVIDAASDVTTVQSSINAILTQFLQKNPP